MIRKSIFDTPATPRLVTFLEWVRDGQLFIPDFQRPFEWDDERRLNLLDSVSRGLPIGAFLVWRTRRDELRTYDNLGPFPLPKPIEGEVQTFLIDGHQRLTTLYAALTPPENPEDLERLDSGGSRWPMYFDLTAADEERAFVFAPRRRGFKTPQTWLPTNHLFSNRRLFRHQRMLEDQGHNDLADRVEALMTTFKDYMVPVMPLVTDDMRAVTDSFVRINSGGKPMAEDKLLRALIYDNYRIDEHIDEIRSYLGAIGWSGIDSQTFVNALKIRLGLDVYRSTPADIERTVKKDGEAGPTFRRFLGEVGLGMRFAAELFQTSGFPGPAVLPYQYQLIGLSEALLRTSGGDESRLEALRNNDLLQRRIHAWLWRTTYVGYFTGMTSSQIARAIDELTELVESPSEELDIPKLDIDKIEPLSDFHAGSTRSTALVLCMAQSIRDPEFQTAVHTRLGADGLGAVESIFPGLSSTLPGNRVVTTAARLRELRRGLDSNTDLFPVESSVLRDHFVSDAALDALHQHGQAAFCEVRGRELSELERKLIEPLGLRLDSFE